MSSDDNTIHPEGIAQRTLAAIVFTDIVGFSSLASRNEERTINMVRRDLTIMSNACTYHGGQVLKNTGDGLLMYFPSAVEALESAIEMQNQLAELGASLPANERLQHRIGVHLGDVIIDDKDVYGDGVNVAARLQAEAKPDTIVFSRTVHDVVKGKMKVDATYLGPRTLKNIAEPIMLWQITSPLQAKLQSEAVAKAEGLLKETPPPEPMVGGKRALLYVLASIVALGVPIILFMTMFRGASKMPDTKHDGPTLMDKLRAKKNKTDDSKSETTGTTGSATATTASPTTAGAPTEPTPEELLSDPALQEAKKGFDTNYDFAGFATWLRAQGFEAKPGGKGLIARYDSLDRFTKWFEAQIVAARQDSPIMGNNDPSMPGEYRVWAGKPGSLSYQASTGTGEQEIKTLPPKTYLAIARAAYAKGQAVGTEQSEATMLGWFAEFEKEFGP